MEKTIELTMDENRTIIIKENGKLISIEKDCRSIKADDIYKLLDYNRGDTYRLKCDNKKKLDMPVFEFFTELFKELVDYLNTLSNNGDYTEIEEEVLNNQDNWTVPFDEDVPF